MHSPAPPTLPQLATSIPTKRTLEPTSLPRKPRRSHKRKTEAGASPLEDAGNPWAPGGR